MRLSCVPDFFCQGDHVMNKLIDRFFLSFIPTNTLPTDSSIKVISIEQYLGYTLADFQGKVVVTFRHFPWGYSRDFYDLCNIGPQIKTTDWLTYSQTTSVHPYYELDRVQQMDGWRWVTPTNVIAQDVKEWALKVTAMNRYGMQYEYRVAKSGVYGVTYTNECHDFHTYHAGSYTLPPLVFKEIVEEYSLYDMHASRFQVGTVYMDFISKTDTASLLIR